MIGDDEHGWSPDGIFNFESGCYAKAIKLSAEAEPEIFSMAERFGTIMENVVLDPLTVVPDFGDESKTENTRIAYPIEFIPNASTTGRAGHAKNVYSSPAMPSAFYLRLPSSTARRRCIIFFQATRRESRGRKKA